MTQPHANWVRVSRGHPCPICGRPDSCEVSRDGRVVWCGRIQEGSIRQNKRGQSLHFLESDRPISTDAVLPITGQRNRASSRTDWPGYAVRLARDAAPARLELADLLAVSADALAALGVGWNPDKAYWSFPERDGHGKVIGINALYRDGGKKRLFGSKAGLTYAEDWDTGSGPVLLVEGPAGTAAAMTLGLSAVGRPSNFGGVPLLIDLLFEISPGREIIVLGERAPTSNSRWPGKEGAISTATRLAEALERTVAWALPPDRAKDVWEWVQAMPPLPSERLADLFLSRLDPTEVNPPLSIRTEINKAPPVPLDEWRTWMLEARIRSLGHPGVYLDSSAPGAGKSHADFDALAHALNQEEGMRALLVYPTHVNCREPQEKFTAAGMHAASYPARITEDTPEMPQNCWNTDADLAESMGLPVVPTVCAVCRQQKRCYAKGYLGELIKVQRADVALCTHQRAANSGLTEVTDNRRYVSIHENPIDLLRSATSITVGDLVQVQHVLKRLLSDPKYLDWFGDAMRVDGQGNRYYDKERAIYRRRLYDFSLFLADLVDELLTGLQDAQQTSQWWPKQQMKRPQGIERLLFHATRTAGVVFLGQPWRFVLSAAAGELHSAAIVVSERKRKGEEKDEAILVKSALGFRNNLPSQTAVTWFNDATITADRLETILGRRVDESTPKGRLPLQKKAVQVLRDIARRTSPRIFTNLLRGVMADRPQFMQIGVICHRPHVTAVESLETEFARRIAKVTYFGSGIDRSSNEWHEECDLIIVAGTPRVPPSAIAEYLMQVGEVDAACCEPSWGPLTWWGETESGEPVKVKSRGYMDEAWRRAHRDLVRAALVQAVGRGRGILEIGCEVLVLSNEECGLLISDAGLESLNGSTARVLWALRQLTGENSNKNYIGNSPVSTRHIAQLVDLSPDYVRDLLRDLEGRRHVRKVGERSGWLPVDVHAEGPMACSEMVSSGDMPPR